MNKSNATRSLFSPQSRRGRYGRARYFPYTARVVPVLETHPRLEQLAIPDPGDEVSEQVDAEIEFVQGRTFVNAAYHPHQKVIDGFEETHVLFLRASDFHRLMFISMLEHTPRRIQMRNLSAVLICLAVLVLTSGHSQASYRFNVDQGAHADFTLRYTQSPGVDLTSYAGIEVVFDELDIRNNFLALRSTQFSSTLGYNEEIFLFSDGPQAALIPFGGTPNAVVSLWVTIGGFNSRNQAAQDVSGVISEIRLRPIDPMGTSLLIDDFSGPATGISLNGIGGGGTSRRQFDLDPDKVFGGERTVGTLLYRNANPGVTGSEFTIDGDGTGSQDPFGPGVVPEPSSGVIWLFLLGIAWRVKTRWI